MMYRYLPILIFACAMLSRIEVTIAQTGEDEAMEAFRLGVERFEGERFEDAVRAFRRANELNPSWKIYFNIGQCEAALTRYGQAMEAFERYLAQGGDEVPVDRRDYVVDELKRLREMIGYLQITGPDRLNVIIDGEMRGRTPLDTAVRVTAGVEHTVVFGDGDQEKGERRVTVGSGQTAQVNLPVEKNAGSEEPPAPVLHTEIETDGADGDKGLSPAYFWTGVSATGVFGVSAVALEIAIRSKWKEAEDDPANPSLKQDGKSLQAAGIAALCLTGAAAVTTGILAVFTNFHRDEKADGSEETTAFAPIIMESGGGIAVRGRF